ncbi:MAG: hypothetical protein ACLFRD_12715, partial [Nitriliruptoraceae bacterium]
GLAALSAAGHEYSFVPRIPGMVCTIDGRPDPCNGAPEDAYWSYWRALEGGSWSYASRGAGEQDPKPGDVEGWAFGAGDPPGTAPPAPGPDDDEAETDTGQGDGDDGSETSGDGDAGADDGSGSDDQGQDAGSSDGGSGGGSEQAQAEAGDGDDPSDERGDEQGDEQGDTDADGAASSSDDGELDRDGPQVPRPAAEAGTGDDAAGDDSSREDEDDPGDEDAPSRVDDRSDEVEDADAVAIGGRSGGADWAGVAVGATLVVALAGGAVLQGRRRRLGPGP